MKNLTFINDQGFGHATNKLSNRSTLPIERGENFAITLRSTRSRPLYSANYRFEVRRSTYVYTPT